MSDTYSMFEGDTPVMTFSLYTQASPVRGQIAGKPLDLTAASSISILITPDVDVDEGPATPLTGTPATCVIAATAQGTVTFDFSTIDPITYGMYPLMFIVENKDGSVYTWPMFDDMWLWVKPRG